MREQKNRPPYDIGKEPATDRGRRSNHGVVTGNSIHTTDVDDTPVNGATTAPISSNWAYDHENDADPHTQYMLGVNTHKFTVGDTEPVSPSVGDIWLDVSI